MKKVLLLLAIVASGCVSPPGAATRKPVPSAIPTSVVTATPIEALVTPMPAVTAAPSPKRATPAPTPTPKPVVTPAPVVTPKPVVTPAPPVVTPAPQAVATPVPDPYAEAKAAGAIAVCADGSYSFSTTRQGACSQHGGVHWWTGLVGAEGPGSH